MSLSSENLTLDPGTYYFESISMTGSSVLTIKGSTTIYISGNVSVSGSAKFGTTVSFRQVCVNRCEAAHIVRCQHGRTADENQNDV